MATFKIIGDPMVSCPIEKAHRMLKSKLQMHITKCRRDHPDADIKTCPFNAQHIVASSDYQYHVCNCADRSIIDKQIIQTNIAHQGATNVPSYHNNNIEPLQEYWDDANIAPCAGYDPVKSMNNKKVIRDTAHLKPLEKKEYYKSLFDQSENVPAPIFVEATIPKEPIAVCRALNLEPEERKPLGRGSISAGLSLQNGVRSNRRIAANFSAYNGDSASPSISIARGRGYANLQNSTRFPNTEETQTFRMD